MGSESRTGSADPAVSRSRAADTVSNTCGSAVIARSVGAFLVLSLGIAPASTVVLLGLEWRTTTHGAWGRWRPLEKT